MDKKSLNSDLNQGASNLTAGQDKPAVEEKVSIQPEGRQLHSGVQKEEQVSEQDQQSSPQKAVQAREQYNIWIRNIWMRITKNPISIVYALLFTIIPGVLAYEAFIREIYPLIRPLPPMSGEFNVAIAPFTLLGTQGRETSSQDGKKIADFVYGRLETSLSDLPDQINVEVRGPENTSEVRGADVDERERAAAELSANINAHILIYGVIRDEETAEILPEFYVNYQGFEQADEIRETYRLGNPLMVKLPFDETKIQDVENPALSARVNALSLMVIGLAYDSIDKFDQAISYYRKADEINGWMPNAGKDVLYLLLGNTFLRKISVEKDPRYLPDAEKAYDAALEISPDYPRALMGKGGVAYLRALGDPYQDTVDSVDMNELREAEGYFQAVLEQEIASDNMNLTPKAYFNLGQIHLVRAQVQDPMWFEPAQNEFMRVIDAYENGNERIQEMAAQAYARMGLINRLQGNPETAIDYYKKAIKKSSPYYQAYYNSRIAEVYVENGMVDEAIAALEEASRTAEFYSYPELYERYTRRINELRGQSP